MRVLSKLIVFYVALGCNFALSVGDKDNKTTISKFESETKTDSESIEQSPGTQGAVGGVPEIEYIKIDIKNKETNEYLVYEKEGSMGIFYVRPGYGIKKINSLDHVIWNAEKKIRSGEKNAYAIKVEVDGLGSKNKLITVHLANGKKELFSKSSKYDSQDSGSSPESNQSKGRTSSLRRRGSTRISFRGRKPNDGPKYVAKQKEVKGIDIKGEENSTFSETSGDTNTDSLLDVTGKSQRSDEALRGKSLLDQEYLSEKFQQKVRMSEKLKESSGICRSEHPEDVILVTSKKNENGFYEESMENDPEGYIVNKLEDCYEYQIKEKYEVTEVKFEGETVWKHSGAPEEPFPKSVIYKPEGNLFTINMKEKFDLCVQMTGGEWYVQTYNHSQKK